MALSRLMLQLCPEACPVLLKVEAPDPEPGHPPPPGRTHSAALLVTLFVSERFHSSILQESEGS